MRSTALFDMEAPRKKSAMRHADLIVCGLVGVVAGYLLALTRVGPAALAWAERVLP